MENTEIRQAAKKRGVKLWQLADALNVSEATMTRMLRKELVDEKRSQILAVLDQIATEREVS